MHKSFTSLATGMLKAGIDPRYVHRTVMELRDHETDLINEAVQAGYSTRQAKREARSRIGANSVLLGEALNRGELHCRFRHLSWFAYRLKSFFSYDQDWVLTDTSSHGPDIARWGLAACLGGMLTITFLAGMQVFVKTSLVALQ